MSRIANATDDKAEEIEITPEMITQGADELMNFPLCDLAADEQGRRAAVEAVFKAMMALVGHSGAGRSHRTR